MWRTLGLLFAISIIAVASDEFVDPKRFDNYSVYAVWTPDLQSVHELMELKEYVGQELEFFREPTTFPDRPATLLVPPNDKRAFEDAADSQGLRYAVITPNIQEDIDRESSETRFLPYKESEYFDWTSYHTLTEIYDWLDTIEERYPDNVQVLQGGKSYEGRDIKGVKLSFGENKPRVFIEGGIHAREWISPATVTYIINEFLTSNDTEVRELAESSEWYLFPSVNPDGYVYTYTLNRLWRKTRSKNGMCRGADANRNWGYKWMSGGASNNPCAETFAGRKAFSEVETRTLSNFISSISDNLYAYISFHSYSQLLMFPYGHTSQHLDNHKEQLTIGYEAAKALSRRYGTSYKVGGVAETIYVASGGSMDWVKATYKVPMTFTYELRDTGRYGFMLPANQIIPNAEEVVDSLVAMFKAGKSMGYPGRSI